MVLSTTFAFADSRTFNTGSITSNGWTVTSIGQFGGQFGSAGVDGVYSTLTGTGYSRAIYPMNMNPNGTHQFDAQFRFQVNNRSEGIWLGVAATNSSSPSNNQLVVGYPGYGNFVTSIDGTSGTTQSMTPSIQPANTTQYVAHVTSNDGYTITLSVETTTGTVVAGPVTRTMPNNQRAAYLVIQLNNRGPISGAPSSTTNPSVTWVRFEDRGGSGGSATPTASPSPSPSPSAQSGPLTAAYLSGIREFYANQPIVHMSNQSVIYNPDGTIKQVITGNVTNATATPTPAAVGTPTAVPNATAVPAGATATPVATTLAATKTQSPGFEMVLAAIGMISALVLITRKKK